MFIEKLAILERILRKSYNENLGIRLSKDSPHYREIVAMGGDSRGIKRLLNLN